MGARRPFFVMGVVGVARPPHQKAHQKAHQKERELQRDVARTVEATLPGVEVLALELTGKDRFCVFVDHPQGVDHALCERVTDALRRYLDSYSVEVSSPGFERPLRTRAHFARVVGRAVRVKTETARTRGTVVAAGERGAQIENGSGPVDIPYDDIVRANLIDEGK
jgi:ribosome maturation factor RimP